MAFDKATFFTFLMVKTNIDFKNIPEPFQFNPLKHHLLFIRSFIEDSVTGKITNEEMLIFLKHIGRSVMDVYTGSLAVDEILPEIMATVKSDNFFTHEKFKAWTDTWHSGFRLLEIKDGSLWTIKYHRNSRRYIHIFPSRFDVKTFRVKANTMKSAILYLILNGRDYISATDLNVARSFAALSPVRNISETEAIAELIEILRK